MHMPDYILNVDAVVKLEQEPILDCTLCLA